VLALVVNLTGHGSTGRDFQLGRTGLRTCLQVGERDLARISAAATLRGIARGRVGRCVLPFVPLLRGGAGASIIALWKQLAMAEPDARRRADYGGLALVFAELAGCREAWRQALEGWSVEQSQQVLEWQAEARKQGKAEGKAEMVLQLLELRFGTPVPPDLATRIRANTDLAQLDSWFQAAHDARSLAPNGKVARWRYHWAGTQA
jgi:hypothetical protein